FDGSNTAAYCRPGSNGNLGVNSIAVTVVTNRPAIVGAFAGPFATVTRNSAAHWSSFNLAFCSDSRSAADRPSTRTVDRLLSGSVARTTASGPGLAGRLHALTSSNEAMSK